jgi:hypothetical protein
MRMRFSKNSTSVFFCDNSDLPFKIFSHESSGPLPIPNYCCLAPIFWPDFWIDFIVAPEEIIPLRREGGRPKGIIKEHLTEDKISAIPILGELLPSEQK